MNSPFFTRGWRSAQPPGCRNTPRAPAGERRFGDVAHHHHASRPIRGHASSTSDESSPYARSDALLSHRRGALALEAGASYLEPLRPYGYADGEGPADFGTLGSGFDVGSRWLSASASLVPVGVGPLRLSGRAGVARFAPPASSTDAAGRPAADRADVRAELAAPLLLGGALTLAPWVRGAATAYAFETGASPAGEAWAVGGVALATEVSRRFGEVRHVVSPRVEWRGGTAGAGRGIASRAYDLFDLTGTGLLSAAPAGGWRQVRGAIETRLSRGTADLLRVEVGQDYDAGLGQFGETFGSADVAWRRLGVSASARAFAIDDRPEPAAAPQVPSPFLDRFTELRASASLSDARGDLVRAGFSAVGGGGSGSLLAGVDPLFDLRPTQTQPSATASVGARAVWSGATLGYDVLLYGRAGFVPACTGGSGERRVDAGQPQQHVATAVWDSPCRCFRIVAVGRLNDCGGKSGSLVLDLGRSAQARSAAP
jgi:LPS-assembly protein